MTRKLKFPLKGDNDSDSGGGNGEDAPKEKLAASDTTQQRKKEDTGGAAARRARQNDTVALAGVRWRVCPVRKIDKQRRLVILRGYARAAGRLHKVAIRAMLDTGAQGEFMAPELARRLGATVESGEFGVAVEAFGRESALTKQVRNVEMQLPGAHPASLLAQTFTARWNFIVSPTALSPEYDMLLGTHFLRRFRLGLTFHEPGGIQLTAADGLTTQIPEQADGDERIEDETGAQTGSVQVTGIGRTGERDQKPLTQAQRRALRRELREDGETRLALARRAAQEHPELVMSTEELERLWHQAKPGTLTVYTLWARGQRASAEDANADGGTKTTQLNRVAHGAGTTKGAEEETDGSLLPVDEREHAAHIVSRLTTGEYKSVFADELPAGVPPLRGAEPFRIELKPGTQPFGRYGPRMTEANTREAEKMLKELLAKGFIRPSRSPWGSPMFLVDKPDGSKRMVIDYRALNAATQRNRYPLPRVDELFDQLQGARYFSKIDLRTGYWQIRVAAEDVPKTAFTSRHGHFEWLVLPMGLTNAPAEFMALMENTFRAELNKFVLVFLDDILIYSKTLEEHEQHLRVVLQRLKEQQLYAKLSKCQFMRQEVEFLGHYVGRAGVRMVDGKVAAVEQWPTPTCQKDVEQFLGLAGYYRRFIANFSRIAAPLSELCGTLRKDKVGATRKPPKKAFAWGEEQQRAFEELKRAVSGAPCLAIPDTAREFIVHTDASGYATGAVLMQQFDEGLRPIAFLSKKMTAAERNYPVHEQELLAILNALKAWRHYLSGRPFTVLTDHQSLQYVETSAMATPRQMRWAAWLAEFDFHIKYVPGKGNVVADALSRGAAGKAPGNQQPKGEEDGDDAPRLLLQAIGELAPLPVRVRDAAAGDADYQGKLAQSHAQLEEGGFAKAGKLLYKVDGTPNGGQLVVPNDRALRTWLLSAAHDSLMGAHQGAERTVRWLKDRVWWPHMAADTQRYVRGCEACQRNKPDTRGKQGLPLSIDVPKRAFDVLCMDFIGPLPRTARGHNSVMVVVDKLTRYAHYIPMRTTDSGQEVFALLNQHVLANHGVPSAIISDRDSRFTSHFWEDLWAGLRTTLKRSTAFHPQTDGQTERQNRTLIEALRAYVDAHQGNWDVLLPELQLANNAAVCASTGYSPYAMLYGRAPRTELDAELETDGVAPRGAHPGARELAKRISEAERTAREVTEKAQAKQRRDAERGRRPVEIGVGDKAWLANKNMRLDEQGRARKLEPLYFGPYEVLEMHGTNAAKLKLPDGCRLHPVFNLDLLRKYVDGRSEFPDRPVQDARPGPLPEEDPLAGGPGAPTYEVEAVIGKRRRGAQLQYRVKWQGWPVEQASWLPVEECESCADAVAEFEQRQLEQQQRVNAVHALQVRNCEERVAQWLALAAVQRRGRVALTEQQQRQQREAAIKAVNENMPPAPDRPKPNAHGEIDMGSQRCAAETKKGGQCKATTRYGAYCWVHRAQLQGARIKPSTVAGAGKGLFATRDFAPGELIARYTGDLIDTRSGAAPDGFDGSHYVLELSERVAIDAARTNTADGRMVNDARGSGQRNNCRFSVNQQTKSAVLRATRRIRTGQEFLVAYGGAFWPAEQRGAGGADRAHRAVPLEHTAGAGTRGDPIVLSAVRASGGTTAGEWHRAGMESARRRRMVKRVRFVEPAPACIRHAASVQGQGG